MKEATITITGAQAKYAGEVYTAQGVQKYDAGDFVCTVAGIKHRGNDVKLVLPASTFEEPAEMIHETDEIAERHLIDMTKADLMLMATQEELDSITGYVSKAKLIEVINAR